MRAISAFLSRAAALAVEYEIVLVTALVAGSVVLSRLLPWVIAAAAILWALRFATQRRSSRRTPMDAGIALLAAMALVALWATALPEKTAPQVYRLFAGIAWFYAIAAWARTDSRLRWLMAGVSLTGLALALIAPVSVTWYTSKLPFIPASIYERFPLLMADTVHPNTMGGNLVLLLPIPLALLVFNLQRLSIRRRIFAGLIVAIVTAVIVLTKSRGAWLSYAGIVILFAMLRWRWGWSLLVASGLGGAAFAFLAGSGRALEALARSDALGTLEGRLEIWLRAIYMIQDFPFTGIGMGSFADVVDVLYPFFLYTPGQIVHSHNLFLQVAVDLGLPGLIAWLSVLLTATALAWVTFQAARRQGNGWGIALGAGLLGSQLALVVHGSTDAVTWGMVRTAPIVWALWGLSVAGWFVYAGDSALGERSAQRTAEFTLPRVNWGNVLRSKAFRLSVGLVVGVISLYLALRNVSFQDVRDALLGADLEYVGWALASVAVTNLAKAARWKVLMGAPGKEVSLADSLKVVLVGQALNTVYPARIGDVTRAYIVGGMGPGRVFVFGTVVIEKLLDMISYSLLTLVLLLLIPLPSWFARSAYAVAGITLLGLVCTVFIIYRMDWIARVSIALLGRMPGRFKESALGWLDASLASLAILKQRSNVIRIAFWSVVVWVTAFLTNHFALLALQMALPLTAAILILIVLQLSISLPSIPGRIGVFEYLCVLSLAVFGIAQAPAFSYGILLHVVSLLPTTTLGLLFLGWYGLSAKEPTKARG